MKCFITIIVAALLFTSCKTIGNTTTNGISEIEYEAMGCFGRCATERFKILTNHSVIYEGKRNVRRLGKYAGRISAQKHVSLIQTFIENGFDQFEKEYLSNVRDLPKFSIRWGNKTIVFQEREAPKELINILKELQLFSNSIELTKTI